MSEGKKIKVRVTTTVEVEVEAWALDYGLDPADTPAIREDVQIYCSGQIRECPQAQTGALTVVSA